MSIKKYTIILLCFFFFNFVSGQFNNLKFENLDTAEGLSSSTCTEVFQDEHGFLWFGTIDGLNKYNGYEFEIFRPVLNDSSSISNNRINKIREDNDGNLWIGTENGLNFLDKKTKKFSLVELYRRPSYSTSPREIINDLLYDSDRNQLWVATNNGAVKIQLEEDFRSLENLQISHYVNTLSDKNSIDNNNVKVILKDKDNSIWICTNGQFLNRYESGKDKFERTLIQSDEPYELNHIPKRCFIDADGDFWIGNDLSNFILWSRKDNTFNKISLVDQAIPVYDLFQDSNGFLWFSTDGHGLFLLNKKERKLRQLKNDPYNLFSLPNDQPSKVYEDKNGVFWIGSYNKGVSILDPSKSSFGHYYYHFGNTLGLNDKIVQSVLQDSKKRIWISTYNGGINLFNEKNNSFELFSHNVNDVNSLSSNKILYTFESHDGSIWICTLDGGLNNFNPETKEVKRYWNNPNDPFSIGQNAIWTGVEDAKHRVWLGLRNEGLNLFDPVTQKFYRYKSIYGKKNSLISDFVFCLFIDSKNRLLLGTSLGLNVTDLNKLDGYIPNEIEFSEINAKGIVGNRINHITEDYLGNIWLGTDHGIFKLDSDLKVVQSYFLRDGLPNNLITGIKEDVNHNLWITTKSGLSMLNPETDQFKNYNVHDGVQGMEFQSKSIEKTLDGRIIAGGINGFNIFHPDNIIHQTPVVFKPQITNLKINNQNIVAGDTLNGRVLLNKPISETEKITLKYNETNISFEYVTLYFQNPERVKYSYRMENLDNEFINVGSSRIVNYSNLQAGEYKFEVRASVDGEQANFKTVSIGIKVLPPPWKTWWAYSIYFILTLVILWLILHFYTKEIHKSKEYELNQMKLKFFVNVSHEFRTPLTLILNPLNKILSKKEDPEITRSAATIQRSARRLLYLVNQLLDYRKMDLGMAPLKLEKGDIVEFCKDNFHLFEGLAQAKGIEYEFKSNAKKITSLFDFDKVEKIYANLISNAIKFTNEGGKITVSVSRVSEIKRSTKISFVEIKVEDTGIGLKKEQLRNIFTRFFKANSLISGTGIGLNFTKGLVDLHGGDIKVESTYKKGSTFVVRLPLNIKGKEEIVEKVKNEFLLNTMNSVEYEMSISNDNIVLDESEKQIDDEKKRLPVVLIVEDNKELRLFLKNELENTYIVKEAVNGVNGLKMVSKCNPDIIISDVMMPKMDGFEMCTVIKTQFESCHIPVVLLTARTLEEDRLEGYKNGADAYLPKPFEINVLKARVQNLLDSKKRIQEKFSKLGALLPSNKLTTNNLDEAFLEKTTKVIIDNIADPDFKLENLLKEIGIGRSQFYRKTQSITGQNPSNFIRTIRLKHASELLLINNYTIKEVTHMTGFNSTAYFSKTFKEIFKLTPSEYIKKHEKPNLT